MFRLIVYLTIFLLTTLIGCSSNTPEDIVSKYIKGVQNFEARKVWESSNYNFLDETLLPEEKDKIFQEYKIDFDKREKQIFNIFPHSAKYKIFSKKNVSENETEVFVKVNYETNEPYKANELKSATVIKVKFGVKTYKNGKSIRSLTVDSIINHNKDFDNQKLTNDLLLVSESNPGNAYKKCSDIVKGDEEYFSDLKQNCKKIYTLWEKQKKEVLKKELLMDADEFIYIKDQSYKYNTASYRTEDIHYSEHDGDLTYHRTIPGSTHTEIYGVDIMAKIKSKFKQRKVRTQVTIWAKSKEGADRALFGSVYWGNKVINDSFYVEVPPKGIAISKYYSLETGITKTTGLLGEIGAALDPKTGKTGTYLESSPIISLSKADEEKKIEGKAIWEKKRAEISLVFEKLKKTNSDPTVSAKDKLAKWNNFYKSIEDDIIGVSKDNEYREETKIFIAHWKWMEVEPQILKKYNEVKNNESNDNIPSTTKLKDWENFLKTIEKDFIGTDKDDDLRHEAKDNVYLLKMKIAYNDALLNDDEKLEHSSFDIWNSFLNTFDNDLLITNEDDKMRDFANVRKNYWEENTIRLFIMPLPTNSEINFQNLALEYKTGIRLKPGNYQLKISAGGYEDKSLSVSLNTGVKKLDIRLNPKEKDRDGKFVSYFDGTVKDTSTGLMWAAKDSGEDMSIFTAQEYCNNYRGGGYTDWRMPTPKEILGLYDKSLIGYIPECAYNDTCFNKGKFRYQKVFITKLITLSTHAIFVLPKENATYAPYADLHDGNSSGSGLGSKKGHQGGIRKRVKTAIRALPVRTVQTRRKDQGIAVKKQPIVESEKPIKETPKYTSISPEISEPKVAARDGRIVAYDNGTHSFSEKSPHQIRASHILIKLSYQADKQETAEAMKKIKDIQQKLRDGEGFVTLAKEFSECPSSAKGGDLGYFGRGMMVKPFENEAFKLKIGAVSGIVRTSFGFHLIKVTDQKF